MFVLLQIFLEFERERKLRGCLKVLTEGQVLKFESSRNKVLTEGQVLKFESSRNKVLTEGQVLKF